MLITRKKIVGGLLIVLALLLPPPALAAPDRDLAKVADATATLGSKLYGKLRRDEGNIFFSPASISWALAMTHAGARGATAKQLDQVLGLRLPAARRHGANQRLLAALRPPGKGKLRGGVELAVANALWAQRGHPILPGFSKLIGQSYGGALERVDFKGDPAGALAAINSWVSNKTRGKIGGLLPEGSLDPLTRLALTNAVYFKGLWRTKFKKRATQDAPFQLGGRKRVEVPLMRLTGSFRYRGDRVFQVLELPYRGGELGMVILLPRKVGHLAAVERYLQPAALRRLLSRLPRRKVRVQLPRFELSQRLELPALLRGLGVRDAFTSGRADLSGIDGTRELYLSAAMHKAWVEVNEEGTEAAAATAIIGRAMEGESEPDPPLFRADRPFLFLIRHRATGAVLFVGRLSRPEGAALPPAGRPRRRH